jgi:hypothetical protein
MRRTDELASFRLVMPNLTAVTQGHDASRAELMKAGQEDCPDVILVTTPNGFGHDRDWVERFLRSSGNPVVLYWEGDAWHRWAKPINASMGAWLTAADTVFSTARELQTTLLRRRGAKQVRFVPNTYCHVMLADVETADPLDHAALCLDAVVIGSGLAHWGRVSRVPGRSSERVSCESSSEHLTSISPFTAQVGLDAARGEYCAIESSQARYGKA